MGKKSYKEEENFEEEAMAHDMQSLLNPTHDAFEEILKEEIKVKLIQNEDVMEKVEELAELGASIIEENINIIFDDIITDLKKYAEIVE